MVLVCVLMASGGDRNGWGLEKKVGSPIIAPPSEPTKNNWIGGLGTERKEEMKTIHVLVCYMYYAWQRTSGVKGNLCRWWPNSTWIHCQYLWKVYIKKSTKCRDGWMEALADKVHKQREHIPQHFYISHNHPYISSSEYCVLYQPVPPSIHPSLHLVDFFKNLFLLF